MEKPTEGAALTVADLSAESAAALAEFDTLAAGEAPPPGSPEAIAAEEAASRPPIDLAAEFDGLLEVMATTAAVQVPDLATIWTADKRREVAERAAAVCAKHGWLQNGIFGAGYAEEIALVLTLAPLAFATWRAIRDALAKLGQPVPLEAQRAA